MTAVDDDGRVDGALSDQVAEAMSKEASAVHHGACCGAAGQRIHEFTDAALDEHDAKVRRDALAAERERGAQIIEALIRSPLTTEERWQNAGLRAAARALREDDAR